MVDNRRVPCRPSPLEGRARTGRSVKVAMSRSGLKQNRFASTRGHALFAVETTLTTNSGSIQRPSVLGFRTAKTVH